MQVESLSFKLKFQKEQLSLIENGKHCAYVYVHTEIETGKPFYVGFGETVGRPWSKQRNEKHKEIAEKSGYHVFIIASGFQSDVGKFWEACWIKALRNAGYDLANKSDGGEGCSGYKHSEEALAKISLRSLDLWGDDVWRENQRTLLKEAMNRPDVKAIKSEKSKNCWKDESWAENQKNLIAESQRREDVVEKKSKTFTGLWKNESYLKMQLESRNTIEARETQSKNKKELWSDDEWRRNIIKIMKEAANRPSVKENNRKTQKIVQNKPEVKAKTAATKSTKEYKERVAKILAAAHEKRTSEEKSAVAHKAWETKRRNKYPYWGA